MWPSIILTKSTCVSLSDKLSFSFPCSKKIQKSLQRNSKNFSTNPNKNKNQLSPFRTTCSIGNNRTRISCCFVLRKGKRHGHAGNVGGRGHAHVGGCHPGHIGGHTRNPKDRRCGGVLRRRNEVAGGARRNHRSGGSEFTSPFDKKESSAESVHFRIPDAKWTTHGAHLRGARHRHHFQYEGEVQGWTEGRAGGISAAKIRGHQYPSSCGANRGWERFGGGTKSGTGYGNDGTPIAITVEAAPPQSLTLQFTGLRLRRVHCHGRWVCG